MTKDLLFGNISLGETSNALTSNSAIEYLISAKRFVDSIFAQYLNLVALWHNLFNIY